MGKRQCTQERKDLLESTNGWVEAHEDEDETISESISSEEPILEVLDRLDVLEQLIRQLLAAKDM